MAEKACLYWFLSVLCYQIVKNSVHNLWFSVDKLFIEEIERIIDFGHAIRTGNLHLL